LSEIAGIRLHQIGGKLLALLHDLVSRGLQGIAADHHAPRSVGTPADRHLSGVALHIAN
jgi:hypothetical protein